MPFLDFLLKIILLLVHHSEFVAVSSILHYKIISPSSQRSSLEILTAIDLLCRSIANSLIYLSHAVNSIHEITDQSYNYSKVVSDTTAHSVIILVRSTRQNQRVLRYSKDIHAYRVFNILSVHYNSACTSTYFSLICSPECPNTK